MNDHAGMIYSVATSEFGISFALFLLGLLMIKARLRKDQEPDETTATSINQPLGMMLIFLGVANLLLMISLWMGLYWLYTACIAAAWFYALKTLWVLPRSIKQRRANAEAVRQMKAKIKELENLKNDLNSSNPI